MYIDTNLRRLKRHPGGYSLLTDKAKEALKQSLCDSCGRRVDCGVRRSLASHAGKMLYVAECNEYQPPLKFYDKTGTGGLNWNTVRMGSSWASRVEPGDVVALVDKFNVKFGSAEVLKVYSGPKEAMLRFHARFNHMLIGVDSDDYASNLTAILRKAYGPLVLGTQQEVTVIYLKTL